MKDDRWKARYDDIPRLVAGAEKFREPEPEPQPEPPPDWNPPEPPPVQDGPEPDPQPEPEPGPTPAPDEKKRIANPLNLRRGLHRNALTKGLVGFDEFAQQIVLQRPIPRPGLKGPKKFEPRPWADADDTALAEHLNSRGFRRVGSNLIREVVNLEARSNPFHPVRKFLDGLEWDGTGANIPIPVQLLRNRSVRRGRRRKETLRPLHRGDQPGVFHFRRCARLQARLQGQLDADR